jgi:hypothetical protein
LDASEADFRRRQRRGLKTAQSQNGGIGSQIQGREVDAVEGIGSIPQIALMTHNAFPVTDDSIRRSVFFCYMPAIGRNNLPDQRMSIYPDHVLERLSDQADIITSPGYI